MSHRPGLYTEYELTYQRMGALTCSQYLGLTAKDSDTRGPLVLFVDPERGGVTSGLSPGGGTHN